MNFAIRIDPPTILSTGEAVDNVAVFGSLKMARAALEAQVADELDRELADYEKGVETLKRVYLERRRDLRASRDAALKVREADLPSDEEEPCPGSSDDPEHTGEPAAPAAAA